MTKFFNVLKKFLLILLIVFIGLVFVSRTSTFISYIIYAVNEEYDMGIAQLILNGILFFLFFVFGIIAIIMKNKKLFKVFIIAEAAYIVLSRFYNLIFYAGGSGLIITSKVFDMFASFALIIMAILYIVQLLTNKKVFAYLTALFGIISAAIYLFSGLFIAINNIVNLVDVSDYASGWYIAYTVFTHIASDVSILSTTTLFVILGIGLYKTIDDECSNDENTKAEEPVIEAQVTEVEENTENDTNVSDNEENNQVGKE